MVSFSAGRAVNVSGSRGTSGKRLWGRSKREGRLSREVNRANKGTGGWDRVIELDPIDALTWPDARTELAEFGTSFRGKRLVLLEPAGNHGHESEAMRRS
jgi:hypothetical protein